MKKLLLLALVLNLCSFVEGQAQSQTPSQKRPKFSPHSKRTRFAKPPHAWLKEMEGDSSEMARQDERLRSSQPPSRFAGNPATTIRYGLPKNSRVTLKVFDALGQEVAALLSDVPQAAGYHVAIWDGRNKFGAPAPSGLFFYQLQAGDWVLTQKMILVK